MPKNRVQNILICGGTGLLGQRLSHLLQEKSYNIAFFTRNASKVQKQYFHWDPINTWLNPDVLKKSDVIINLSGSSIAEGRWTKKRKSEIFNSRIQSTRLLYNKLLELKHIPSLFINASAIGLYPCNRNELMTEDSLPGKSFLSYLAWHWEKEAFKISELGIRTVVFRIGLVLSNEGGFLPKMMQAFRFHAGSTLGNGKQYMSWIHIDDLCAMFLEAIQSKKWQGVYNAVSPNPVSNQEFTLSLAKVLKKPILLSSVPALFLKILFGELSTLLLDGSRVSAAKVLETGFRFHHPDLESSLLSLLLPLNQKRLR